MPPQGPRSPRTPMGSQKRRSIKAGSTYSSPVPVLDSSARYAVSSSSPSITNESDEQQQRPRQSSSPSIGRRSKDIDDIEAMPADHHVKIVCVGDGGCGKTCLMVTYAHGTFPETYVPTVFENYLTKVRAPSGKIVELALWDTAGQEEYDRLRALSYPEANVLLVCFAIDQPASLDNVYDKWIPEIAHHCPGIPFIIIGLKTDLRSDMTSLQHLKSKGQRPITTEEGKKVAQQCGAFKYMECSARAGTGVAEIFNQSISIVLNDRPLRKVSGADSKKEYPRPPAHSITQTDPTIHSQPPVQQPPKRKRRKCIIL
ncbi:hypothetical protein TRICI_004160 [Trichomonascus ciferrii]|uniref:Uncharacterized protein n=1 Tax=Trichomonascus ciferrii TaxID=44093 RepID=A0A642V1R7_9ASCO|nr:hypothetical protein TRICI_004160 [Trichomonascus ciferrii]